MAKERIDGRVVKRYDEPRTAYQRLLESGQLTDTQQNQLRAKLATINPAAVQRRIDQLLRQLWQMSPQEPRITEDAG